MRIPVPEMDARFNSTEDAIEHTIRICNVIVNKAKQVYSSTSVSDIPGYALEFCRKILIQVSSLVNVSRERKDYSTVCTLVRMLADNVATINLVYCQTDDEERIIRHLLYVLDGITDRYKLLEAREVQYNGTIPIDVFEALKAQVDGALENAKGCIEYCQKTLRRSPHYAHFPREMEFLIQRKNWKFKDLAAPNKSYTWKEMYEMLEIKTGNEMFSYLSQYVHGLSVSNIVLNDEDDFDAPLSFAFCLLYKVFDFLRKVYEPHLGDYTWEDIRGMAPELFAKR